MRGKKVRAAAIATAAVILGAAVQFSGDTFLDEWHGFLKWRTPLRDVLVARGLGHFAAYWGIFWLQTTNYGLAVVLGVVGAVSQPARAVSIALFCSVGMVAFWAVSYFYRAGIETTAGAFLLLLPFHLGVIPAALLPAWWLRRRAGLTVSASPS